MCLPKLVQSDNLFTLHAILLTMYLIIGRAEILTASLMAEFVSRSISFLLSGKEYTDTLGTHGPLHT